MRCPSCGNVELRPRARECGWCGLLYEVKLPARADPSQIWAPPPAPPADATRPREVRGPALLVAIVLSGLAALIWVALRSDSAPSAPAADGSATSQARTLSATSALVEGESRANRSRAASAAAPPAPELPLTQQDLVQLIDEIGNIARLGTAAELSDLIDPRVDFTTSFEGGSSFHAMTEGRPGLIVHWMGKRAVEEQSNALVTESATVESLGVDPSGREGTVVRIGESVVTIDDTALSATGEPLAIQETPDAVIAVMGGIRCNYVETLRVRRNNGRARVVAVRVQGTCQLEG